MILVTGASGFVGSSLVRAMMARGMPVRAASRSTGVVTLPGGWCSVDNLGGDNDWRHALDGIEAVVHCAARVHVMHERTGNPLTEFRRSNVEGTLNLARQASQAGVRRLVFLSSVKVNGESTSSGPFRADDPPHPIDAYGVSKCEAEYELLELCRETGLEVTIIRPPLVYGPGVKANFETMMHWLACGIPLPLAAITQNQRSLVALDNLVDLILTCLSHPAAANQTFLVSDGEDLSTAELLRRMSKAMGKPTRLFYVPTTMLKLGATLLNKNDIYQRLCGSLQVDIGKTKHLLNWTPLVSVDEGLRRTAEGFRA